MSYSYETPKSDAQQPAQPAAYQAPSPAPNTVQTPPAYHQPNQAVAVQQKSKVVAGLLGIFLGALGLHKFYLGYTQAGLIMLLVSLIGGFILVGPLVMGIIGIIEGIIYLTKSDQDFYQIYVVGDKPWF